VHCTVGAPKESFVKMERAEAGGLDGEGLWHPAAEGYRPGYESKQMLAYLAGELIR
jgi:nitrate reductase alpha subunit